MFNSNSRAVAADTQAEVAQQTPVFREEDHFTRLIDLAGNEVARYAGKFERFSPDGQRLLSRSSTNFSLAYLFDISGAKLLQFESTSIEGISAKFSPNGQRLIISWRNKIYTYDATGRELAQVPGRLRSLIFSSTGQRIAAITEDGTSILDASGRQIAQTQGQFLDIGSGFDATGQQLVLSQLELPSPTCNLLSSSGQIIKRLSGECAGVSPDGQRFTVAIGALENLSTQLYDFSGKLLTLMSGSFPVFSADSQLILSTEFLRSDSSYLYNSAGEKIVQLQGKNGRFSSNGQRLVTVSGSAVRGSTVYLYDALGHEIAQVTGDRAAFLPNSEKFITFSSGVNENLLDISGGKTRLFDGSGQQLALLAGGSSPDVDLWLSGAGMLLQSSQLFGFGVSYSFFSSDGQRLVTEDSNKTYLYASSGEQVAELQGSFRAFSPTGQNLVTVSEGKTYLFDRSGNQLLEIQGEFGDFSPDGEHLAVVTKIAT